MTENSQQPAHNTPNNSGSFLDLSVKEVFLWAGGSTSGYELPTIDEIPRKNQRRFSELTRIVLFSALKCSVGLERGSLVTVLSSRHGEINNSLAIFHDIINQELVSPQLFTGSVFNMPFANYSIIFGNKMPSTALASATSPFCYGFLEAVMNLIRLPGVDVLFTCADVPLNGILETFNTEGCGPYSFSMILSGDMSTGRNMRFTYHVKEDGFGEPEKEPGFLEFYHWFTSKVEEPLSLNRAGSVFTWAPGKSNNRS